VADWLEEILGICGMMARQALPLGSGMEMIQLVPPKIPNDETRMPNQ
jgi:hypothetical protein